MSLLRIVRMPVLRDVFMDFSVAWQNYHVLKDRTPEEIAEVFAAPTRFHSPIPSASS
jgi:hypothetical protein